MPFRFFVVDKIKLNSEHQQLILTVLSHLLHKFCYQFSEISKNIQEQFYFIKKNHYFNDYKLINFICIAHISEDETNNNTQVFGQY